jgi:hypothetical protein
MKWDDYSIVMPGRIIEYFPANQTATVLISAKRVYNSATESQEQVESGLLYDVPVHTTAGGTYALTLPIQPLDTCLLLFSQFGYDHWLWQDKDEAGEFSGNPSPWQRRVFSKKDGLALVGFNPVPRAIPNYSPTDAEFRNLDLDQFLSLRANGDIDIEGPADASLTIAVSYTVDVPVTTWTGDINLTGDITQTGNNTIVGNVDVTGGLEMNGNAITGAADPVGEQDVATKAWVDAQFAAHLFWDHPT